MSRIVQFRVSEPTDDSKGAVAIAGVPIASDELFDGDMLAYDDGVKQFTHIFLPYSIYFIARGADSVTPVTGTDIPFPTDISDKGDLDIVRVSPTTFRVARGTYLLQFSMMEGVFAAQGVGERVVCRFYNATDSTVLIGPTSEISGYAPNTTVVCGVSMECFYFFNNDTDITVRATVVTGTNPALIIPTFSIYGIH